MIDSAIIFKVIMNVSNYEKTIQLITKIKQFYK